MRARVMDRLVVLLVVVAGGLALLVTDPAASLAAWIPGQPPEAQPDEIGGVPEGECVQFDVVANDVDADTDHADLALTAITEGPWTGSATVISAHLVQYCAPTASVTGDTSDQFTYEVSDGELTATAVVTATIVNDPNNDPPLASADFPLVEQGDCVYVDVLFNDVNPSGQPLTVSITTPPAVGTATLLSGGTIQFCIDAGIVPDLTEVTFGYAASDDDAGSATATVFVTVLPPSTSNTAPIAIDDADSVARNGCYDIDVLANDGDEQGDALTVTAVTAPDYGTATVPASAAAVEYCAPAGYAGPAFFDYTVSDGVLESMARVQIQVVNTAPTAADDAFSFPFGGMMGYIDVVRNDVDEDGDRLYAVDIVKSPNFHGNVVQQSDGLVYFYFPQASSSGVYTFTYRASDGTDTSDPATVTITIDGPPAVTAPAAVTVPRGVLHAFDLGSFTDPDASTAWEVVVDWGDGTATEAFPVSEPGPIGTRDHTYAAAGDFTVTITVWDSEEAGGRVAAPVQVLGERPVYTAPAAQTAKEGTAKSLTLGRFTDPDGGPWQVLVSWGDGSADTSLQVNTAGAVPAQRHTYAADGAYTVTVTVSDATGSQAVGHFSLTVENVAPGIYPIPDQSAVEGRGRNVFLGYLTDPGADDDPWTVRVDWGDGTAVETYATSGTGAGATRMLYRPHTFPADGAYTVTITVTDSDDATGTRSLSMAVANVAPALYPGPAQTAQEGRARTVVLGYLTDPGVDDDPWTVAVDWGDGTALDTYETSGQAIVGTRLLRRDHIFPADGAYTVTVTATDDDGGSITRTLPVTVSNIAPSLYPAPAQTAVEGRPHRLFLGYLTDPGADDDPWTVTVDWGDGTPVQTAATGGQGAGATRLLYRTYTFSQGGTYTVTVNATDVDGASATRSFTVVVNGPPSLSDPADQTAEVGPTLDYDLGSFTDVNPTDTAWTVSVGWGDGSPLETWQVSRPGGASVIPLRRSHAYASPGAKRVTVSVTDPSGGLDTLSFLVTVAPNPPVDFQGRTSAVYTDTHSSTRVLLGTLSDASPSDRWTVVVDWGDGSTPDSYQLTSADLTSGSIDLYRTHVYLTDLTATVTTTVTDAAGSTGSASFLLYVAPNSPPGILRNWAIASTDLYAPTPINLGVLIDGSFYDRWTIVVDWGDGSAPETFFIETEVQQGVYYLDSYVHVFTSTGTKTITFSVTDAAGTSRSESVQVNVNPPASLSAPLLTTRSSSGRTPTPRPTPAP